LYCCFFFFSSRRRHTRFSRDWSSDVCSSDLNMTSILSEMYKSFPEKKDGAYTIFYMGVNAGAFFGMMLCGYLASNLGWHYGFGLAGIFMFLGTLQFWYAKPIFG